MENMIIQKRAVTVKQMPEAVSTKKARAFLREIQSEAEEDRPRMVLDCSNLLQLDKAAVQLLLSCLEEVMKRNGDLRLATLPAGSEPIQEQTGITRLFGIYDTTVDAVASFDRLLPQTPASPSPALPRHNPESAP